jgi:hypothetical protein
VQDFDEERHEAEIHVYEFVPPKPLISPLHLRFDESPRDKGLSTRPEGPRVRLLSRIVRASIAPDERHSRLRVNRSAIRRWLLLPHDIAADSLPVCLSNHRIRANGRERAGGVGTGLFSGLDQLPRGIGFFGHIWKRLVGTDSNRGAKHPTGRMRSNCHKHRGNNYRRGN